MKNFLKLWVPPILLHAVRNLNPQGIRFRGKYESWEEAVLHSQGYDHNEILERIKDAALKVKAGEAACERDSVVFDIPQYSWSSLACLLYVAACHEGKLSVLDFGGSLGSSYFLNRKFFVGLDVEWSIVEQRHFVDFGKQEIGDNVLSFYEELSECLEDRTPNCLFLSSVLQYLDSPYEWLRKFVDLDIEYILIDRMPFSKNGAEFIQIQDVPKAIYKASYPIHILNREKLINALGASGYILLEEFDPDVGVETSEFSPKGMFFARRGIGNGAFN